MQLKLTTILTALALVTMPALVSAQTPAAPTAAQNDIQGRIDARTADIQALEADIQRYQAQIAALGSQASSLANTIKELDLTRKKLEADIRITEDKIDAKNLQIRSLTSEISATAGDIADDNRFIGESFKKMNEVGDSSVPRIILSGRSVSDIWNGVAHLAILESEIQDKIVELGKAKTRLESNKTATERAKADLVKLEAQLTDQKKVILATTAEQQSILKDTKNSEAAYQRGLREKESLKADFESELYKLESDLKLAVDVSKLPKTGSGVLRWPLDSVYVTQYFGNTPYATANAQLYSGKGHNGIDLRATIGTPIMAAAGGVIAGQGNTDTIPGCYSLGKWILVKHPNGLSTLYAHLSLQTLINGATIQAGQVIGYTGNTGYTTGPHLHFGVYASSGIEIRRFAESSHCGGAVLPIASFAAYLNPLSYLPAVPR